jgi:hypothetical protein
MNIVWNAETVRKLFEVGPERLYAWHQDAGAADRLGGRSQGADGFPDACDGEVGRDYSQTILVKPPQKK